MYLNLTKPEDVREAVFVHEVLHIVLHHEGFPGIAIRARFLSPSDAQALEKLRDRFSSTIDHLQVYKRMITEFNLNFDLYFDGLVQAKIRRFGKFSYNTSVKDAKYYFYVQQDILDGLEYYQYPNLYSQRILAIFKETCPEGFASCLALREKINMLFYTSTYV
ncbi:hypothetical protein M1N58_00675 [Dehalococcoidales bacterium]|nr:hypothetical protein [Dehalococcoidales bacterium]